MGFHVINCNFKWSGGEMGNGHSKCHLCPILSPNFTEGHCFASMYSALLMLQVGTTSRRCLPGRGSKWQKRLFRHSVPEVPWPCARVTFGHVSHPPTLPTPPRGGGGLASPQPDWECKKKIIQNATISCRSMNRNIRLCENYYDQHSAPIRLKKSDK